MKVFKEEEISLSLYYERDTVGREAKLRRMIRRLLKYSSRNKFRVLAIELEK